MWYGQRGAALLRSRRRMLPAAYSFINVEAAAFVARMTALPSDGHKAAYDQLFGRLKIGRLNGSSLLSAFDVFYVRAAPSQQAALLNLAGTGWTATLSATPPAFHPGYGFTTDGMASYVEWGGWTIGSGAQYQRNSACIGYWARRPDGAQASGEDSGPPLGVSLGNPGGNAFVYNRNGSSAAAYRINDATSTSAGTVTDGSGFYCAVRPDASTKRLYKGAVDRSGVAQLGGDAAVVSTAPGAGIMREGSGVLGFAQNQLAFAWAGRALTAAEVADLYDALGEYLLAIGWQQLFTIPVGETAIYAAATVLPAYTARVTLPDIAPTLVTGKGFTCTGAAIDPRDGTWWVAYYGKNKLANGSTVDTAFNPKIVHLAADRATLLGTIDLVALGATAGSTQGLAFKPATASLFVSVGGALVNVTADTASPVLLNTPVAGIAGNALGYDTLRGKLATGGDIGHINEDGTTTGRASRPGKVPGGYVDQITYCADLDAFLVTGGDNGKDGVITRIGMNDQNWGALRASAIYVAPGCTAIEGIVRDPATKVATVFNDWWFHGGSASLPNGSARVQLPG